jgi:hypothetical protein
MQIEEECPNIMCYDDSIVENTMELNFMGAKNFKLTHMLRFYVVWSSGILGEPQYYRNGKNEKVVTTTLPNVSFPENYNKSSYDVFMETLLTALDMDFKATLEFALTLRNDFKMRLGPQIILVEASLHKDFNKSNPNFFRKIAQNVIYIPSDIASQIEYITKKFEGKKLVIPNILKKCWADAYERFNTYQYAKYGKSAKMIDGIRLSHPSSEKNGAIATLIKNGKVSVQNDSMTWEKLHSTGKSWKDIIDTLGFKFPHMALLRNLKNIAKNVDSDTMTQVMKVLAKGVPNGKQFPFRYYTAFTTINDVLTSKPKTTFKIIPLSKSTNNMYAKNKKDLFVEVVEEVPVWTKPKGGTDESGFTTVVRRKVKSVKTHVVLRHIRADKKVSGVIVPRIRRSRRVKKTKHVNTNTTPHKWRMWRLKLQGRIQQNVSEEISNLLKKNVEIIKNGLETCIKIAIQNFPKLEGRVVSLCDNSGSAHGAFTSTYGSQSVATIANLSGLITAMSATKGGQVGIFGDRLHMYNVSKDKGVLEQLDEINLIAKTIGQSTENGIWLWFKDQYNNDVINKISTVDHLFVYSDMQAGHGGLYGSDKNDYKDFTIRESYIDVIKLIERHRQKINDKLNVFSVQVAGYDNSLIPETLHRSCIMAGWTGNEVTFAKNMIDMWNATDDNNK